MDLICMYLFLFVTILYGVHGLRCLSCQGVAEPRSCIRKHECAVGEICYTEQVIDDDLSTYYNVGCRSSLLCDMAKVAFGRRRSGVLQVCQKCCKTDNCNIQACQNSQNAANICSNCRDVTSPLECRSKVECRSDEVCFTQQFVNANFEKRFNLGCEKKKRCDLLRELAPYYRSLQLCNQCCQGSECNKKLCSVECYHNWIPDGDSCYFVSDVSVTWKEAEGHCHRYDSSLVEVPDTNKTDVIKSLLESQYTNHTTADKFFWIGGYGHNGDFIWKSNGKPISFQNWNKGNQLPVPGGHYEQLCLEMVQSSDFKWNYALCISTNPFVCERKKN